MVFNSCPRAGALGKFQVQPDKDKLWGRVLPGKDQIGQIITDLWKWGSFFPPFIFVSWRLITLQYCSGVCFQRAPTPSLPLQSLPGCGFSLWFQSFAFQRHLWVVEGLMIKGKLKLPIFKFFFKNKVSQILSILWLICRILKMLIVIMLACSLTDLWRGKFLN